MVCPIWGPASGILLFSDAPDVDVESIIVQARRIFKSTKPSMCARQFSGSTKEHIGNYQVDHPSLCAWRFQLPLASTGGRCLDPTWAPAISSAQFPGIYMYIYIKGEHQKQTNC